MTRLILATLQVCCFIRGLHHSCSRTDEVLLVSNPTQKPSKLLLSLLHCIVASNGHFEAVFVGKCDLCLLFTTSIWQGQSQRKGIEVDISPKLCGISKVPFNKHHHVSTAMKTSILNTCLVWSCWIEWTRPIDQWTNLTKYVNTNWNLTPWCKLVYNAS